ncbi:hypothetical protein F4V44_02570 [Niallia endozanthoxylica]|uniref:Uncharacterized protein n=2 Tax=Niallia endozanthoxylica TaxID=2036016 RepID=A0A5J5I703_9BACI|nr:hypothetical protein F4V44_02570 [Niallia endozanthoxylica]
MVRYLAMTFLLLLASFFFIYVDHHSPIHYESQTLMDHESFHNEHDPIDDKDKLIYFSTFISLLLFPYLFTNVNPSLIQLIRRKALLTPIFYQSNYVITAPLR